MDKYVCIDKIKDKNGRIIEYKLKNMKDLYTNKVKSSELKEAIKNNKVRVLNLALTKDGRLIDKKLNTDDQEDINMLKFFNKAVVLGYNIRTITTLDNKEYYILYNERNEYIIYIPRAVKSLKFDAKGRTPLYNIIKGDIKIIGGKGLENIKGLFTYCILGDLDLSELDNRLLTIECPIESGLGETKSIGKLTLKSGVEDRIITNLIKYASKVFNNTLRIEAKDTLKFYSLDKLVGEYKVSKTESIIIIMRVLAKCDNYKLWYNNTISVLTEDTSALKLGLALDNKEIIDEFQGLFDADRNNLIEKMNIQIENNKLIPKSRLYLYSIGDQYGQYNPCIRFFDLENKAETDVDVDNDTLLDLYLNLSKRINKNKVLDKAEKEHIQKFEALYDEAYEYLGNLNISFLNFKSKLKEKGIILNMSMYTINLGNKDDVYKFGYKARFSELSSFKGLAVKLSSGSKDKSIIYGENIEIEQIIKFNQLKYLKETGLSEFLNAIGNYALNCKPGTKISLGVNNSTSSPNTVKLIVNEEEVELAIEK